MRVLGLTARRRIVVLDLRRSEDGSQEVRAGLVDHVDRLARFSHLRLPGVEGEHGDVRREAGRLGGPGVDDGRRLEDDE